MLTIIPPSPSRSALREALEDPCASEITVLLDLDTVDLGAGDPYGHALEVLLSSRKLEVSRFRNDGPPSDTVWFENAHGERAPVGWLHVAECALDEGPSSSVYVTHVVSSSRGSNFAQSFIWANPEEWRVENHGGSESAVRDRMLGRVASASGMALVVTRRSRLVSDSGVSWHQDTLCAEPGRACAALGLLLRTKREFPVEPFSFVNRGTYFWLATDALLPDHGRWVASCSQAFADNYPIYYFSRAVEARLAQAFAARDELAVELSRERIVWLSVADALDRIMLFLLAAFDASARVTHFLACSRPVSRSRRKWHVDTFRIAVAQAAPDLAQFFETDQPGGRTLTILRELRNSIHGGGYDRDRTLMLEDVSEVRLSMPATEFPELMEAIERSDGGASAWGIHEHGEQVWFEPDLLADRVVEKALTALNEVFRLTPDEVYPPLYEPDDGEIELSGDLVDRGGPQGDQGLRRIIATRGSDMYLQHLGIGTSDI